ncbi:unnamed protein product [Spirodela intermedia]|uniref:Uncharacterized protein n=1 Tax=Spirodela intermedia TaxID=51605 RepID=A0A7I8KNZ4_SPIIN|nr:unnamed protein product [Spirodela intermedia]
MLSAGGSFGELAVQCLILILAMAMGLALYRLPLAGLAGIRRRRRAAAEARQYFIHGAQLLARARSAPPGSSAALSHARSALEEADRAVAADPRDAAAHILRSAALELQGRRAPAIRALDAALSPPAARSLASSERADALTQRAGLRLAVAEGTGRRRERTLDAAVEDLTEAVRESPKNVRALSLLGQCYQEKGMTQEARRAYESALAEDDSLVNIREALRRLPIEPW